MLSFPTLPVTPKHYFKGWFHGNSLNNSPWTETLPLASRFIAFGRQAGVNFFKIKKSPKVENISSAVKKWGGEFSPNKSGFSFSWWIQTKSNIFCILIDSVNTSFTSNSIKMEFTFAPSEVKKWAISAGLFSIYFRSFSIKNYNFPTNVPPLYGAGTRTLRTWVSSDNH